MKLEDVRVGMILRDIRSCDWIVVGKQGQGEDGRVSVVSRDTPDRVFRSTNPRGLEPVPSIPAYDPPVEESEPEAEPVGTFEERNQASWAKWAGEQLGEQRELLLSLTKERDELKTKLVDAEKQAEQARRLWSSWHEQKAVLAALDVEFGGKP